MFQIANLSQCFFGLFECSATISEDYDRKEKKSLKSWIKNIQTYPIRDSSLCLAVEADPGRAVPVPEARRVQPVSRPWKGRGPGYSGPDGA